MSIKVRYFASLKQTIGRDSDEISCQQALTVRSAWQQLNPDLTIPETIMVAINLEYVNLDALLQDEDELAFFPPVTGG